MFFSCFYVLVTVCVVVFFFSDILLIYLAVYIGDSDVILFHIYAS